LGKKEQYAMIQLFLLGTNFEYRGLEYMKMLLAILCVGSLNLAYADSKLISGSVSPEPQAQESSSDNPAAPSTKDEQDDEVIMEEDNDDTYEEDDT
jgi:hypothetical protein